MIKPWMRWVLSFVFLALSLVYLNGVFGNLWVADHPTTKFSYPWFVCAWHCFVIAVSWVVAAILCFSWLRPHQPSASTKRRFLILFGVGLSLTFLYFYPDAKEFFEIDKCLDLGGAWEYDKRLCDYGKSP